VPRVGNADVRDDRQERHLVLDQAAELSAAKDEIEGDPEPGDEYDDQQPRECVGRGPPLGHQAADKEERQKEAADRRQVRQEPAREEAVAEVAEGGHVRKEEGLGSPAGRGTSVHRPKWTLTEPPARGCFGVCTGGVEQWPLRRL
jgi:hypothetical protein